MAVHLFLWCACITVAISSHNWDWSSIVLGAVQTHCKTSNFLNVLLIDNLVRSSLEQKIPEKVPLTLLLRRLVDAMYKLIPVKTWMFMEWYSGCKPGGSPWNIETAGNKTKVKPQSFKVSAPVFPIWMVLKNSFQSWNQFINQFTISKRHFSC